MQLSVLLCHMLISLVTPVPGEESDANKTVPAIHQAHSKRIVHGAATRTVQTADKAYSKTLYVCVYYHRNLFTV